MTTFKILTLFMVIVAGSATAQDAAELPKPNAAQLAWQQAELGVVFHYDLHVFDHAEYNQARNRITPIADYNLFNPEQLDTDQWLETAKNAGARFALLTATHETGFALYQSQVNPYCLKAVNWKDGKGDIVRDFVNSCRKYGIKPGIYLGIRWNSFFGVQDFKVNGVGAVRELRQQYYNKMVEGMVKEICTNYGDLFEIWFDGGADHPDNGAPDVLPIVKKYQPDCLFYHNKQLAEARWGGSETGTVPYPCWATFPTPYSHAGDPDAGHIELLKYGDPNGRYWMPAMSDAPLRGYNGRHEWFWAPDDENSIFPLENLVEMYFKSVGRNSTLILGLTPDDRGLIPRADAARMKEFGDRIAALFANPVATTHGEGDQVHLALSGPGAVNLVVLQEDIAKGERVRRYVIEAFVDGAWEQVGEGQCIGHKRIQKIKAVNTMKLRVRIVQSTAKPMIKNFSVYSVKAIPAGVPGG